MTRRRNGEGSIYPVKDTTGHIIGYRGYVWCTNAAGERYRKYVMGKPYEAAQQRPRNPQARAQIKATLALG